MARYRIEPYIMGEPMQHGVIETDNYKKARAAFLISWESMSYGVKVYLDGEKLTVGEAILLFRPEGYRRRS